MSFKPEFNYTDEIISLLSKIEYYRGIVNATTLPLHVSKNMRYRARLKSTHYSTCIEGNPLSIAQVEEVIKRREGETESRQAQEVRNYFLALNFLSKSKYLKVPVSEDFIQRLHRIIQVRGSGRRGKRSKYRGPMPPGYLFCVRDDKTGNVEYIPPSHEDVPELMADLVEWIRSEMSMPRTVKASIAAYQLVTIHPFDDGNGRLARALALYVLMLNDYDLNGYFTVEEHYAKNLSHYYDSLQMGLPVNYYNGRNNPDMTLWITYFLKTMAEAFTTIASSVVRLNEAAQGKLLELSAKEIKLIQLALRFEGRPLTPGLIAEWFGVTTRTVQEWVKDWIAIKLLEPASGTVRKTSYRLGERYRDLKLEDID